MLTLTEYPVGIQNWADSYRVFLKKGNYALDSKVGGGKLQPQANQSTACVCMDHELRLGFAFYMVENNLKE